MENVPWKIIKIISCLVNEMQTLLSIDVEYNSIVSNAKAKLCYKTKNYII